MHDMFRFCTLLTITSVNESPSINTGKIWTILLNYDAPLEEIFSTLILLSISTILKEIYKKANLKNNL